jgi:hypothetical protein
MIDKLESRLMDFPGASNRARCFTHILNLVVKSIMHQFDVRSYVSDERYEEMAGDLDSEEVELEAEQEDYCEDEAENPDNDDGWIDERDEMEDPNIEDLEDKIQPVHFLLTKVGECYAIQYLLICPHAQIHKLAFAIKNSSTIALPQWFHILDDLSLHKRVIPRDVRTRWNATYDMLEEAYKLKAAVNKITEMRDMKLCQYEINGVTVRSRRRF